MKNEYRIEDNICYMKTCKKKNEFIFDAEYIDKVIQYVWKIDYKNNPFAIINDKKITLKKFLFGDGIYVHIDGNNLNVTKTNVRHIRGYKNNGKSTLNGYTCIYMPEHKYALSNGCVYEHVLEAEIMLGRELKTGEVVHHIDKNRNNNNHDNLIVFRTNADHTAYHNGCAIVKNNDESYSAIINSIKTENGRKDKCPLCENLKSKTSKLCYECNLKNKSKNIPSKDDLEKLIYNTSFLQIGRIYNVSDNAVRKWCEKYNLPFRRHDINNMLYK